MIVRHFDEDAQILHVYYAEVIRLDDVLASDKEIFLDTCLPRNLKILEDARDATYDLKLNDNKIIMEQARSLITNFTSILSAFLQDKPLETAVNMDYQFSNTLRNFKYRVFTDKDIALQWLSNDFDHASV